MLTTVSSVPRPSFALGVASTASRDGSDGLGYQSVLVRCISRVSVKAYRTGRVFPRTTRFLRHSYARFGLSGVRITKKVSVRRRAKPPRVLRPAPRNNKKPPEAPLDPRCAFAVVLRYTSRVARLLHTAVSGDGLYKAVLEPKFDLTLARMASERSLRTFVVWPPVVHLQRDDDDTPTDGYGGNSSRFIEAYLGMDER